MFLGIAGRRKICERSLTLSTRIVTRPAVPNPINAEPRKTASQSRSRATVEALLDATARILVREGYDGVSTNRIAAVAGVSIGSLYQYFPNKEALVVALLTRHNRDMLSLLNSAMARIAGMDLESGVFELVDAMISAHRVHPELHRIFAEQVPNMGSHAEVEAIKLETTRVVRAYLDTRRSEIRRSDLDLVTMICVTTVESLTHEFVLGGGEGTKAPTAEDFTAEVTQMLCSYLRASGPLDRVAGGKANCPATLPAGV